MSQGSTQAVPCPLHPSVYDSSPEWGALRDLHHTLVNARVFFKVYFFHVYTIWWFFSFFVYSQSCTTITNVCSKAFVLSPKKPQIS